ncbi:hypothetical protein D3C78_1510560 [compost metagenome]
MEACEFPIISLDTDSSEIENSICSTNSPWNDSCFRASLISSLLTGLSSVRLRIANETLGVGTRTAFPVNFPAS